MSLKEETILPNTSIFKGHKIWFVCKDGERIIHASGAAFSGKETIYLDGIAVSEKRTYSRKSEHHFTAGQDQYTIVFHTISIITGRMKCQFYKNNVLFKSIDLHFTPSVKPSLTKKKLVLLFVFAVFSVEAILLKLLSIQDITYMSVMVIPTLCFNFFRPQAVIKETDIAG